MSSGDPVCNINQRLPVPDPQIPPLPPVPKAWDLSSALAAIRALTQIVNMLNNRIPPNQFVNIEAPDFPEQRSRGIQQRQGNFTENREERITKKVKIVDPDDPDVFVIVEQITGLTFFDGLSRRTIKWTQ